MTKKTFLAALGLSLLAVTVSAETVFKIELSSHAVLWAKARPTASGASLLFEPHPRGPLMSVKRSEVVKITAVSLEKKGQAAVPNLKPGQQVVLGQSAPGAGGPAPSGPAAAAAASNAPARPGETKEGTAMFNPDRPYRADWDAKQVPGVNIAQPNSPGDYREGGTLAHPPANAVQAEPGQPPMMPPSSGDVPR